MNDRIANIFGKITVNADEQSNVATVIKRDTFNVISSTFQSVSLVQAFVILQGITNFQLGIMNSMSNLVPILATFLLMGAVDQVDREHLLSVDRKLSFSLAVLPIALIMLSLFSDLISTNFVFIVVLVAMAGVGLIGSLRPIIRIKVYKRLFVSNIFGSVSGISGAVCHTVSILAGYFAKFFLDQNEGQAGYTITFVFALLAVLAAAYYSGRVKLLQTDDEGKPSSVRFPLVYFIQAFKDRKMLGLSLLHIVRGAYSAVLFFIFPIGVRFYQLELKSAIIMTILISVSALISYFLIFFLFDRIGPRKIMAIASAILLAAICGFALFKTPSAFLVFYSLLSIGTTLVDISVPLGIMKVTPLEFLGIFTGVRLLLMSISLALFSTLVGLLIDGVTLLAILLVLFILFILQMLASVHAFALENQQLQKAV